MAQVGYARVSSRGQSLEVQQSKLKQCDKLFEEKESGLNGKRPQLTACLDYLREGDTLVITRLDRLARSTLHLCELAEQLEKQGVNLKVLDQSIDTSDATGRLLFNMLGSIAQFETEIRAERQAEGIARARERGVALGRKNKLTEEQIIELRQKRRDGAFIKDLMRDYALAKSTVYQYLDGVKPEDAKEEQPEDPEQKTLKVKLYLLVENNNKYVRGRKRSIEWIENFILSEYDMEIPKDDSGYILTIPYTTDEELDETIYDMLREIESSADSRNCFTEGNVIAMNGSDRRWG